ncbi:hypothetical protein ETN89_18040 [Photobacterium damselae subsp. damselae]|uniref:hypothetical protein n=1 Tax=Photobacterium damselae TaxID=38293 RepID=UPI000A2F943B|nr:hypothetical protein [Photobacterium damselae]ARR51065.1 hypothetical protein CAY62_16500 [Photobacterium damselae subsp. damselae]QAY37148.1 hypothetical protein ETN89_18040 [Photobacterium damselae subsp. damselae]
MELGYNANEATALAKKTIQRALGEAPTAAEEHAAEDAAESQVKEAETRNRPPGSEQRDQMVNEARQQREAQQQQTEQENISNAQGALDNDASGLLNQLNQLRNEANRSGDTKLMKQIGQDMNRVITARKRLVNGTEEEPVLTAEERQSFGNMMARMKESYFPVNEQPQEPVQSQFFNPETGEVLQDSDNHQVEAQQEQQGAPEMQPQQIPAESQIPPGYLSFAEPQAQQDQQFKEGLQRAIDISPAAVMQIATKRKSGEMSQEQAISALQRVINSVELNKPDQLRPTEQEKQLRAEQVQQQRQQQQDFNQNGGTYQPNVEGSEAFKRNQARLQQGFNERSHTTSDSNFENSNGERDITPEREGIADQNVDNAPQVEFDRWSEVQPGDVNRDERFSQEANEYELNPEQEVERGLYRKPNVVAQEPVSTPEKQEREPKRNARQQKKVAQREEREAREAEEQRLLEEKIRAEENAPVYQAGSVKNTPFAVALAKRVEVPRTKRQRRTTQPPGKKLINPSIQDTINSRALAVGISDLVGDISTSTNDDIYQAFNLLNKEEKQDLLSKIYPDMEFKGQNLADLFDLGQIREMQEAWDTLNEDAVKRERKQKQAETKKQTIESEPNDNNQVIDSNGISIEFKGISKDVEDNYNRSTHLGRGRDFNAEIKDSIQDIINGLDEKGLLDTPERKAKATDLIHQYIEKQSNFITWESNHAANNPSWIVTGRAGRNNARHNAANDRHMRDFGNRVDAITDFKRSIPSIVESVRNEEQKKAHQEKGAETAKSNREKELIQYIVKDVYNYIAEGQGLTAADNKRWALPKAKKALDTLLSLDRDRAISHIKKIDKAIQTDSKGKYTLKNILGGRRSAIGRLVDDLINGEVKEVKSTPPAEKVAAVNNAGGMKPVMKNAIKKKIGKIETATKSAQKADQDAKKAVTELGELFNRYRTEQGGNQKEWDDLLMDTQGHLDENSWDEMLEEYGNSEQSEEPTPQKEPSFNETVKMFDEAKSLIGFDSSSKQGQYERLVSRAND